MDKIAPPKGSIFTCPICEKRSIVGVTANLVATTITTRVRVESGFVIVVTQDLVDLKTTPNF